MTRGRGHFGGIYEADRAACLRDSLGPTAPNVLAELRRISRGKLGPLYGGKPRSLESIARDAGFPRSTFAANLSALGTGGGVGFFRTTGHGRAGTVIEVLPPPDSATIEARCATLAQERRARNASRFAVDAPPIVVRVPPLELKRAPGPGAEDAPPPREAPDWWPDDDELPAIEESDEPELIVQSPRRFGVPEQLDVVQSPGRFLPRYRPAGETITASAYVDAHARSYPKKNQTKENPTPARPAAGERAPAEVLGPPGSFQRSRVSTRDRIRDGGAGGILPSAGVENPTARRSEGTTPEALPGIEHEPAVARKLLGALPPAVARAILDNGIPFAFRTTLADVARAILEHDSRDGIVAELPGAVLAIGGGTFHAFTQWKQAIYDLAARTARIEPKPWPTSATADTLAAASPQLPEATRQKLQDAVAIVRARGSFAPEVVTAAAAEMSASLARGASPGNFVSYLTAICRRLSKQAPPPLPERSGALGRDA